VTPAAIAETHLSIVFFVGDRAYKLKKPLKLPFVDLSTREQREAMCHREVELNRRLAPDVYLGVADVVGPDHEPCDRLVVMRRLPDARRLTTLVTDGVDVRQDLTSLVRLLAAFWAGASRSDEIAQAATPDALRSRWDASLDEMIAYAPGIVDVGLLERVECLAHRYLDGRASLYRQRIVEQRIVDGHGDLLADDIFCLPDGPRVIDCLEFDDRLRYCDVIADLAFLAMDLERLEAPAFARHLLAAAREFTGDTWPASLAHHYIAERALVRAKVACLRVDQGDRARVSDARRLLNLAARHLEAGRVRLVLLGGLPGTGKSTLAGRLGDSEDLVVLHSDEVRKDLAGLSHDTPAEAAYGEDLYTAARTAATYRELLARGRVALQRGETVVLDASWIDAARRREAAAVARETASDLVELRCVTDPDVAAGRIETRRASGGAHDASVEIAAAMAADANPWPEAVAVDTTVPIEVSVAMARKAIGPMAAE
jgi:aminoglycoside phosphotransferase family enzyme/predicted kinase